MGVADPAPRTHCERTTDADRTAGRAGQGPNPARDRPTPGRPQNHAGVRPTSQPGEIMIKTATAPYAALLLRVSLGILFLAHVGLKIFVFTVPGFVGYFGSLGLPAVLAYAVVALELFGG